VTALDLQRDVLEEADAVVALLLLGAVAGQLDEVERMVDRQCARQVADERDASLERPDQEGLQALVSTRQLGAELEYTGRDLVGVEEDLPDAIVQLAQDAFRSPYRAASRSKSRS
jgi:hypothetical protein